MSVVVGEAAARLVADLMPVAIVVADAGDAGRAFDFAHALAGAGAGAEVYAGGMAGGFDLAVLLADPDPARHSGISGLIENLAAISDRLLFVPTQPSGPSPDQEPNRGSEMRAGDEVKPDLDAWFELFAEQGYQPVVDYDASFLGQGAFLVDRNATAAETDLSAFADRLSMGGALAASSQRVAVLEAELGTAGDRDALKADLTARQADLAAALSREATWRDRAEAAEAALAELRSNLAGWQEMARSLGQWIAAACMTPGHDTLAALRTASGYTPKKRFLAWLRPRRKAAASTIERLQLADAALIRGSQLFDPGWYIASYPDLAASGGDPVWHYVLQGAPAGADPGPWFDTAAYRAARPEVSGNALAYAIRNRHVDIPPLRTEAN